METIGEDIANVTAQDEEDATDVTITLSYDVNNRHIGSGIEGDKPKKEEEKVAFAFLFLSLSLQSKFGIDTYPL